MLSFPAPVLRYQTLASTRDTRCRLLGYRSSILMHGQSNIRGILKCSVSLASLREHSTANWRISEAKNHTDISIYRKPTTNNN